MRTHQPFTGEALEPRLLLAANAGAAGALEAGTGAAWSRYLGGSGTSESATGVAIDADRNILVTGITDSPNFGGATNMNAGGQDAFVVKLAPDGALIWARYFGGAGTDSGQAVDVDAAGNVYLAGETSSTNLPAAVNAFHGATGTDAFVAKLTAAGNVVWSSYVGGTADEGATGIVLDPAGHLFISGRTASDDVQGAINFPHGADALAARLNPAGGVAWARYLGGSFALDVARDPSGNVVVTGQTSSNNLEAPTNTYPSGVFWQAFAAKLTASGAPLWSTYIVLGPSLLTGHGDGVATDAAGNAYVTGNTGNGSGAISNAFVVKLGPGGTMQWQSFIAGSEIESGRDIVSDAAGNTLVGGYSRSPVLPASVNTRIGDLDAFVAKLNPGGTIVWSKFVGGSDGDDANGIASDEAGSAVIAGRALSNNFADALNQHGGGFNDGFAARVPVVPVAPAVTNGAFDVNRNPQAIGLQFNVDVGGSLSAADLVLENLTTAQTIPAASIALFYSPEQRAATFTFPGFAQGALPDGRYRATIPAAAVTEPGGLPMASDFVLEFTFLRGDANVDGRVNLNDFNILAANFGRQNRTFTQGDFNYDTRVNLDDFNLLAARFGAVVAPAATPFGRGFTTAEQAEDESDITAVS